MSEIRVRNDTGLDLEAVRATVAGGTRLELGALPPGTVSEWQAAEVVRRYPSVEADTAATQLVHRPFETEGEALPEGRYTYVLRVESDRLVVGLEREPA